MKASTWLALLAATLIILSAAPYALTQQPEPINTLSYRAFSGLALIYQQGGESPELVAKLNQAVGLIDEARVKSLQGDSAGASNLQTQANTILTDILNQTPLAQQTAANQRTTSIWITVSLVPLAVLLSTLLFYASLAAWRRYEKSQLYKMQIVGVVRDEIED